MRLTYSAILKNSHLQILSIYALFDWETPWIGDQIPTQARTGCYGISAIIHAVGLFNYVTAKQSRELGWFSLVSLFNSISTSVGYLMPKLFL